MEPQQKLTPELVIMAVQAGMLDSALPHIKEAVRLRTEVLNVTAANSLIAGDRFTITNCSPKKWNDVLVEFTGKRDGIWLVCKIVHDQDVRIIKKCDQYLVDFFREVRLRSCHVSEIQKAGV